MKRPAEALEQFSQALRINAAIAETWNNRGTVFNDLKRYHEAIADFDKAISINPAYADAFCNKGKSLAEPGIVQLGARRVRHRPGVKRQFPRRLGRPGQYARRTQTLPRSARRARAGGDAETRSRRSLGWPRQCAGGARGNTMRPAVAIPTAPLRSEPDAAEAWLGRGTSLLRLMRGSNTLAASDWAVALDPALAEAWFSHGNVPAQLYRREEALAAYDRAFTTKPDLKYAEGHRLHAKLELCDWTNLEHEVSRLLAAIRLGKPASQPLGTLSIATSAADQLQCAKRYVMEEIAGAPSTSGEWPSARQSDHKIRIAYISADLNEHPVSLLTVGLFEQHDRTKFETFGVSLGRPTPGAFQARLKRSFDQFIDVHDKSDADVVQMLRQLKVDIAVDLNGRTAGARPGILAARVSPAQVNYLGYPATMGAPFIDYIIADRHVIPPEQQTFSSECVAYLPGDIPSRRFRAPPVPGPAPARASAGLAEDAFVFCNFNQVTKITPEMFAIWMRLLLQIEGSVLWLIAANATAERNLRSGAERHGVAPGRIVITPRADYQDYLARYQLADLFLDTFRLNAGTTASDALWCGVPVLTCSGQPFAARMAGSLLHAAGLPELITAWSGGLPSARTETVTKPGIVGRAQGSPRAQSDALSAVRHRAVRSSYRSGLRPHM